MLTKEQWEEAKAFLNTPQPDEPRYTGRTFRTLLSAASLASTGENVLVLTRNGGARDVADTFRKMFCKSNVQYGFGRRTDVKFLNHYSYGTVNFWEVGETYRNYAHLTSCWRGVVLADHKDTIIAAH